MQTFDLKSCAIGCGFFGTSALRCGSQLKTKFYIKNGQLTRHVICFNCFCWEKFLLEEMELTRVKTQVLLFELGMDVWLL